jgi:hypothetical protein
LKRRPFCGAENESQLKLSYWIESTVWDVFNLLKVRYVVIIGGFSQGNLAFAGFTRSSGVEKSASIKVKLSLFGYFML